MTHPVLMTTLRDLDLGNSEGIPSSLANASHSDLESLAASFSDLFILPEDNTALACIDGRATLHNADNSAAQTRLRRAGGTEANLSLVVTGGVWDIPDREALGYMINEIDRLVEDKTGFAPSAHTGGCGAAGGEILDMSLIASKPAIMKATEALMEIPEVKEFLSTSFNEAAAGRIKKRAEGFRLFLDNQGWQGDRYVQGAIARNPRGVEVLQSDDALPFHGHQESAILVLLGEKTLPVEYADIFVWNLEASRTIVKALAENPQQYQELMIAEIAKHFAVCDRLPHPKCPVIVQST